MADFLVFIDAAVVLVAVWRFGVRKCRAKGWSVFASHCSASILGFVVSVLSLCVVLPESGHRVTMGRAIFFSAAVGALFLIRHPGFRRWWSVEWEEAKKLDTEKNAARELRKRQLAEEKAGRPNGKRVAQPA